jgi:hypothetical protein
MALDATTPGNPNLPDDGNLEPERPQDGALESALNPQALLDLSIIGPEEDEPSVIDPQGLQETTVLLNANLNGTGGMNYTRISDIQRAHLMMRRVTSSYSQGELSSQTDAKPALMKKERFHDPIIAGYGTTPEEVAELYMDMRTRTLKDIDVANIDTTLGLANLAARLGDVEAMNVALGRINELGTVTKDSPASNELFFDTLALIIDKSGKLDPKARALVEPNLTTLVGKLSHSENISFKTLPESVWPFLVAVKEMRNKDEYMLVLHALFDHVSSTPDESTSGARRGLSLHPRSPYYGVDSDNAHLYRDTVIRNYPQPTTDSSQAYRLARGVRGNIIPFGQDSRQTSELVVDTWLDFANINPQKPGVIHL